MALQEVDKLAENKSSNDEEFTLYVSDLPGELNKHGLLEIFNHYGEVKGYFYRPNANWAYITYGTYHNAENAIKDLHNIPPLRLKISFAKEKAKNIVPNAEEFTFEHIKEQYEDHEAMDVTLTDRQLIQTKGRIRPLDIFKNIDPNPGLPIYSYTDYSDLLYPYISYPYMYNPYENAEPYASTNTLWTRGQLNITQDGKRRVVLGRGYTVYEIPDPDPEIHNQINKVYEKRITGLYEYGKDMFQDAIRQCKACSRNTKYSCARCNTYFCDKGCILSEWYEFNHGCKAIPALATTVSSTPVLQSNDEEQSSSKSVSNIQLPLRRPKTNVVIRKEEISNNMAKSPQKVDDQEKDNKGQNFNANDIQMMEHDISFSKNTFLSKTEFQGVTVIIQENRECSVQKVEDQDAIIKLMAEIQHEAQNAQKVEPIIGNIYAVKYENVWHRGVVTCLNPVKVHYIDYGNEEIIETNDFRKIDKYENIPRFCATIRLSEKAYEKYKDIKSNDIISVKMISVDSNEVINVEVQNEDDISTSEVIQTISNQNLNTSTTSTKVSDETMISSEISTISKSHSICGVVNVLTAVTVGECGIIEFHAELENNVYGVTILPNNSVHGYEKLVVDLPEVCLKLVNPPTRHRLREGDLICGQRPNADWLRGYIFSLQAPLRMAIIDEARVIPVDIIVPCDKEYSNIYAYGAICEIPYLNYKFKENEQCEFRVLSRTINDEQCEVGIEIYRNRAFINATVKPWIPRPEQKAIRFAELLNENEVYVTSYRSHTVLFVRSLDRISTEFNNHVMQSITRCAQTAPFLKDPPVVGQMVIAQYADGNHYRAVVTKVRYEKITISYVDFGNTEVTDIKKLQILPDKLKELRSCITKVTLKDVPKDVPMTKEVSDYLAHIVGTEVLLVCTFSGIPSEDGVYLKSYDGENVNKVISELLEPISKEAAENDKTCYMAEDINTVNLGNVGEIVEGLVLHTIDNGYRYAICPLDYDLMTHVYDIMPKKIAAYCEATDHYIPRDNELCLALYHDGWYRAICISRSYTRTTSAVFFIDFGNTEFVSHKNLRLMPKDFTIPDMLANICNIINIGPTDNNGKYSSRVEKRLTELVAPDNYILMKIVGHDPTSGMYNVELPLVKSKLLEEGLIFV